MNTPATHVLPYNSIVSRDIACPNKPSELPVARIVCIGSRLISEDAAGPAVYDRLLEESLPLGVALVDGGLGGLDLLGLIEGLQYVIFVDTVNGFAEPGEVVVMDASSVSELALPAFDHAAGLPYLLRAISASWGENSPRVTVVGVEAPASNASIHKADILVLRLVGAEGQ